MLSRDVGVLFYVKRYDVLQMHHLCLQQCPNSKVSYFCWYFIFIVSLFVFDCLVDEVGKGRTCIWSSVKTN